MNYKDLVYKSENKINKSPIREILKRKDKLPVEVLKDNFKKIENDIKTLKFKLDKPLKLVIMGEVKAGKSTFINSIAEKKVSPTEVTETTASIIEISYQDNENGVIYKNNGEEIKDTIESIYEILNSHKNDVEFFSNIKFVSLNYNLPNLKKLKIIDTPGLGSITQENEDKTLNYIQEADVVLWIFNGNHLGQADVTNKLSKVAKLGKPVIGIVNRVDEVDTNPERLKIFLKQKFGVYLDEVFLLSAYNAFKAKEESDDKLLELSGYIDIMNYLENNIENESERVHKKSVISSTKALLDQDIAFHQSYLRNLSFVQKEINTHKDEITYHNQRIKEKIENSLISWSKNELLINEERELLNRVNNLTITSGKNEKKQIRQKMRNIFSNENLKRLINNKLENINTEFEKDWQQAIEDVKEKISQDIINFINTENDILNERLDEYNTSSELLKNGVGQGAAIGGSLGLTIAAYEAWFGYYSSIATLGMTASAWIPPLLIGGVVVGGVAKLFSYKKEKNKLRKIIKEKFREIKRDKIEGEVVNNIIVNIKEHSDQISEEIHSNFVNGIAENWSEKSLYELEKNIDQYCTEIKSIASKNYDL